MHRSSLWSLALLVALGGSAGAQKSTTFRCEYETQQVFEYQARIESDGFAASLDLEWEVLRVGEDGFDLAIRITRLSTEDGRIEYPDGTVPEEVAALLDVVNGLRYAFDRRWSLRGVGGLERLIARRLEGVPERPREAILQLVDVLLGSALFGFQVSPGTIWTELFARGEVTEGDQWISHASPLGLVDIEQDYEVIEVRKLEVAPVARFEFSQVLEPRPLLGLTGLGRQTVEGTFSIFDNGLPEKADFTIRQALPDREVAIEVELEFGRVVKKPW